MGELAVRKLLAVAAAGVLLCSCGHSGQAQLADPPTQVGGPLARFLAGSTDLGPARGPVEVTVALRSSARPQVLIDWAESRGLTVRWRSGDNWAFVAGGPAAFQNAFGVAVHDYRSPDGGQVFYAARQDPEIPAAVHGDVAELGRILSYNPAHVLVPPSVPLDVPNGELTPTQLMTTYNATPLKTNGKGQTIVFFEIDSGGQDDYNKFTKKFKLPPLKPIIVGKAPEEGMETPMDLQVAHAIAPNATKVIVYMENESVPFRRHYENIAGSMEQADREYPGAIWSISLGYGCDTIDKAADLAPVRGAIAAAQAHGTSVFISSGDTGGYECKGFWRNNKPDFYTPPLEDEIGLSSIASLPEVTDVGGTTLSTDKNGVWVTEAGWADYPSTRGTGGGISSLFPRPDWQQGVSVAADAAGTHPGVPDIATQRLAPDIAAAADGETGVAFYFDGHLLGGGGTSQSAPIWAALTALMNQYLNDRGGRPVADLNPLLYRVAASGSRPAFHDVTFGGNAAYNSGVGFDLATGLGTPNTFNLVNDILDIQKAGQ